MCFVNVYIEGDILNEMNISQALSSEKLFLNPRQGSNPQFSDNWQDVLTIELPRLSWQAKVHLVLSGVQKSFF